MVEKGMVEVTAKKEFLTGSNGFIRTGEKLVVSKARGSALAKRGLVTITKHFIRPTEFKPIGPEETKTETAEEEPQETAGLKYACGQCEQRFPAQKMLKEHDCEKFYCPACGEEFDSARGVGSHRRHCRGLEGS